MQYNVTQRLKIYKQVLIYLKTVDYGNCFLCLEFQNFFTDYTGDNQLPEFELFERNADDIKYGEAFLCAYPYEDYQDDKIRVTLNNELRETVLLFCIEMCKS